MRCSINAGQQKQMKFFKQIYGIQVPVLDDEKFSEYWWVRIFIILELNQETWVEELKIIHFWIGWKKKKKNRVSSGTENFGFHE